MKKLGKTLLCTAFAVVLGAGTMFAQGRGNMNRGEGFERGMGKGMGRNCQIAEDGTVTPPKAMIGQVTAIDEKNGTIKIADLDGKETVVSVSPFTQICVDDSKDLKSISDISKGNWIMYALYNTETEKKLACRIFVKTK